MQGDSVPELPPRLPASSRVAVVTNMIPPYRYPIFRQLVADGGPRFRFFLTSSPDLTDPRAWRDLDATTVRSLHLRISTLHSGSGAQQRESVALPLSLIWQLLRFHPNTIIAGEMGIRSLMCTVAAVLCGAKLILWSEEIPTSAASRSSLQKSVRRLLLRKATGVLAWGLPAADYMRQLGVADRNMAIAAQAIENDYWIGEAKKMDVAAVKKRLGLEGVVLLTVSRLVSRKGIRQLLAAAARLKGEGLCPTFVIIGGGEEGSGIEQYRREEGLSNVILLGPRPREELPQWYAAANAFVFPTLEDVWGLVVNEALCSGLYVLGSKFSGACQQLLSKPDVGRCIDPSNADELLAALRALAARPPARDTRRAEAVRELTFAVSKRAIARSLEIAGRS